MANPLQSFLNSNSNAPTGAFADMMRRAPFTSSFLASGRKPTPVATPSAPSATVPVAPKPAPSAAKNQFIQSVATPASTPPQTPTTTGVTPSGAVIDSTTGSMISSPTAAIDPKAGYKSAYDAYISSLVPSGSETTASKYLNDLILQSKKDQETALNSGETLGFASGEVARVNRNNQFAIDAATNGVNALTSARTATSNATKARADFEKSLLPSDASFSLSPGEARYDSSGKLIASAPAKAATTAAPKIIGSADKGYYTVGADGSVTPVKLGGPALAGGGPSWQDYLKAASQELQMDINPDSETYKQLKAQYDQAYAGKTSMTTKTTTTDDWGL